MNAILTDDEIDALELCSATKADVQDIEAAVLAKLAQQVPVAWQYRMRPTWGSKGANWGPWEECGEGQFKDYQKTPKLHDWEYQARALCPHPAPQQSERQRVPQWHEAVQKVAAENDLEPEFIELVFNELMPVFMADKDAAGYVTLPLDRLIECDSYGVHGSDFYRCRVCDGESGAGVLNKGISHASDCPLAAAPEAPATADEWLPLTPEEQNRLDELLKHTRWLMQSMPAMDGLQHSWALNARDAMQRMHDWLKVYLPPAMPSTTARARDKT